MPLFNFDMYSKRTSFFFNNQEKITSNFGFFLTLVYIVASIVLFIYQIIIAIRRNELKVYDSTIHAQEMPSITVNSDQFYFAFGLEDPTTSNRFIDNSIYIPKIVYIDKVKINDEFKTAEQRTLEYEKCDVRKFGHNYQHLFIKDELNNSYCLKDTDFNITFAGGYKYERMTYIRIRIYPCVNTTENNNSCKSQEEIDHYMSSGYFSIILKDFGLNPSNYSFPTAPVLEDLYTTIDKKIIKNYILNFGITEIHTDEGILQENMNIQRYLQYRKELQTFTFRDEQDYYDGKSVILVQLKLDDTTVVQKRSYTKISDIFSRIGGYMQLMNTVFLLLTSILNKLHCELKIINSIFNFNLKENKVILKFQTLKDSKAKINPPNNNIKNKYLVFSSKKSTDNFKPLENDNKSKNNLIIKENEFGNITSGFNMFENKKYESPKGSFKMKSKSNNIMLIENSKVDSIKSKNEVYHMRENSIIFNKDNIQINNIDIYHKEEEKNLKDYNDHINLNLFDYICLNKNSKQYKLFNLGNSFYRKKMDIVHVFTIISIIEKMLINSNCKNKFSLYEEIE